MINETITWYTPEERMPEKEEDYLDDEYLVINEDGEVFSAELVNKERWYCVVSRCRVHVKLWAYMPKGEGDG